jgi:hypothetical protein
LVLSFSHLLLPLYSLFLSHSLDSIERANFYRNVLVFGCGGATCMAIMALLLLSRDIIGAKRKGHKRLQEEGKSNVVSFYKKRELFYAVVIVSIIIR